MNEEDMGELEVKEFFKSKGWLALAADIKDLRDEALIVLIHPASSEAMLRFAQGKIDNCNWVLNYPDFLKTSAKQAAHNKEIDKNVKKQSRSDG